MKDQHLLEIADKIEADMHGRCDDHDGPAARWQCAACWRERITQALRDLAGEMHPTPHLALVRAAMELADLAVDALDPETASREAMTARVNYIAAKMVAQKAVGGK